LPELRGLLRNVPFDGAFRLYAISSTQKQAYRFDAAPPSTLSGRRFV